MHTGSPDDQNAEAYWLKHVDGAVHIEWEKIKKGSQKNPKKEQIRNTLELLQNVNGVKRGKADIC